MQTHTITTHNTHQEVSFDEDSWTTKHTQIQFAILYASVSHHAIQMLVFATLFLFPIRSFSMFHFEYFCLCLYSVRSCVSIKVCFQAIKRKKIVCTQHDFSRLDRFLSTTYLCLSIIFSMLVYNRALFARVVVVTTTIYLYTVAVYKF